MHVLCTVNAYIIWILLSSKTIGVRTPDTTSKVFQTIMLGTFYNLLYNMKVRSIALIWNKWKWDLNLELYLKVDLTTSVYLQIIFWICWRFIVLFIILYLLSTCIVALWVYRSHPIIWNYWVRTTLKCPTRHCPQTLTNSSVCTRHLKSLTTYD